VPLTLLPDSLRPELLLDLEVHANDDPHAVWRWMRRHRPVHRHDATDLPPFWSLTRYHDVRGVYRDPTTFSSAHGVLLRPTRLGPDPGAGRTLALSDPPRHGQLRTLMARWFTERGVRSLDGRIRDVTRRVLAGAVGRGEVDAVEDVAARLTLEVIGGIMGVPDGDLDDVFRWTNEAFAAGRSLATHHQLMQYFVALMDERLLRPADDLVSALVHGTVGPRPLTEEEVLLNCENMLGASENARLSMAVGIQALARCPDQWDLLRRDPGLVPTAVEEVLRYASSAVHSMRRATRDVVVRDQQLRAGDWVVLWLPSANRDEEVFEDGDRFDVARQPNRHLALGSGEHFCLGSVLGRAQLRALLTELIGTVRAVEEAGPAVPTRSLAVSGPEHLPVRLLPVERHRTSTR
jgi:cytochrome P450